MARSPKKETKQEPLEVVLWKAADKLRKNIDAAEYKHVVLGLIFLKYISDSFEAHYNLLVSGEGEFEGQIQKIVMSTRRTMCSLFLKLHVGHIY
jgi:type I restriction enzyme M protein